MKITELLTEDQQLSEGPLANKIGTAVGKGVGTLAKGVGAVAGGVAGLGAAVKKGFAAGKQTVAGAGDTDPNAAPAAGGNAAASGGAAAAPAAGGNAAASGGGGDAAAAAPAAGKKPGFIAGVKAGLAGKKGQPAAEPAAGGAAPAAGGGATAAAPAAGSAAPTAEPAAEPSAPTAQDINAQGPKGTAAAKPQTGAAATALKKTADATAGASAEKAGQTVYAQVKSQINNLDKKGKQRILQLLQKSLTQPAPADKAAAAPADAGAGAMGQMAGQLAKGGAAQPNTMANAPVSKTNTAKPGNPNAAPAAGTTQDGKPQWDPATGKGAKYDGVTGEMTPAWKAEQDKQAAAKQTKAAPTAEPAPAQQTTGQAATQAADAGGDAEKAALDTMKAKNPKLAGMMAQAGMDDQGNDVAPVKKRGGRKAKPAAPSQAEIDADREARMGPTSDSIIRNYPGLAETLATRVEQHKRKMFEDSLRKGETSIFVK